MAKINTTPQALQVLGAGSVVNQRLFADVLLSGGEGAFSGVQTKSGSRKAAALKVGDPKGT